MQTASLVSALLLVAVVLMAAPQAEAECCYGVHGSNVCGDCSKATPYCGHGRCGLFGCDCWGGCRDGACGKSGRGKRNADGETIDSGAGVVSAGDVDGDGVFSLYEAEEMLDNEGVQADKRIVKRMDTNRDGALSAEEIDFDY